MRLLVTGGTGFVGSNVVKVAIERHAAQVTVTAHTWRPSGSEPFDVVPVDMTDDASLRSAVLETRPDAIIHAAILNDFPLMYANRALAWDSYVTSTQTLVDAANEIDAKLVLVSTDWVFDGTQSAAAETTPPNPINLYGVLKVVGETIVINAAANGAVARIAGVNGTHWLRADYIPTQNPGMGHLAGAIVDALRDGRPFAVWQAPVNMVATPSLASDSAEMMLRIVERDLTGIFHCCGGQTVDRMEFARAVARVFELDADLLRSSPADLSATGPAPIPIDTSLDATATSEALGYSLPDVDTLLSRFRHEVDQGRLAPAA
jgi:dTDP-4-dehydrorhamnose reductase